MPWFLLFGSWTHLAAGHNPYLLRHFRTVLRVTNRYTTPATNTRQTPAMMRLVLFFIFSWSFMGLALEGRRFCNINRDNFFLFSGESLCRTFGKKTFSRKKPRVPDKRNQSTLCCFSFGKEGGRDTIEILGGGGWGASLPSHSSPPHSHGPPCKKVW